MGELLGRLDDLSREAIGPLLDLGADTVAVARLGRSLAESREALAAVASATAKSALRRVQRARARGSFNAADQAKVVEEVAARLEVAHAEAVDRHVRRQLRRLRRDGLFMRVVALIRVSRVQKEAVMPADSGDPGPLAEDPEVIEVYLRG